MESTTDRETRAALVKGATVFLALELSKKRWLVGAMLPGRAAVSEHAVGGGDTARLWALIERLRAEAAGRCGRPVRVVCCYEAGYDGFWLHRWLTAAGVINFVLDAGSLPVSRRGRRAKTDRLDVQALLRVLLAYLRDEPRVCSVVRVPSVAEEDLRRRHRERERLMRERVQHTNRIQGLLFAQGIRGFRPQRRDWPKQLAGLRTGDGRALPACLRAELARECERLALVVRMLEMVEAEAEAPTSQPIAPTASDDGAAAAQLAQVAQLTKLRGIGKTSARPLVGEVFFRDFANRREVASYVGLAASPFRSGQLQREQGISKAGNPRARPLAIELAWLWLRHQPRSALSQWFHTRVGRQQGRVRKIAIVALARKLMVALWRYLTTGLLPTGALLKA